MMPQAGQYVVIIFKNLSQVEGKVLLWSSEKGILENKQGDTYILLNVEENVMIIKIIKNHTSIQQKQEELSNKEKKFETIKNAPATTEDKQKIKIKNLVALRAEMAKQEQEILSEKLIDHSPKPNIGVKYGSPFYQK